MGLFDFGKGVTDKVADTHRAYVEMQCKFNAIREQSDRNVAESKQFIKDIEVLVTSLRDRISTLEAKFEATYYKALQDVMNKHANAGMTDETAPKGNPLLLSGASYSSHNQQSKDAEEAV